MAVYLCDLVDLQGLVDGVLGGDQLHRVRVGCVVRDTLEDAPLLLPVLAVQVQCLGHAAPHRLDLVLRVSIGGEDLRDEHLVQALQVVLDGERREVRLGRPGQSVPVPRGPRPVGEDRLLLARRVERLRR